MSFTHIHHTSSKFLEEFYSSYNPVFILNTGRSGSAFFQKVFAQLADIMPYHEAPPNMFLQSNYAFHNQDKDEILTKMFEVARIELMLEARVNNHIYLETNQCLVFYIKQIQKLFPNAKFLHLTRHPGDFVRSAIRKGWHKNDTVWELGRIKMTDSEQWRNLDHIQKLAWVWTQTHEFIEEFKLKSNAEFITVRFEDVLNDYKVFKRMIKFTGTINNIGRSRYKELIQAKENELFISKHEPPNMFKMSNFPKYVEWSPEMQNSLKSITQKLSNTYNYQLD